MKTSNTVFESVMNATSEYRADVLNRQIAWAEKQYNRKCTEREIEYMKLGMIYDLAMSIGRYIVDTDVLIGEWSAYVDCGKLTISAGIQRDGEVFPFATDVITAGGYNIQCYHIRYIVKTKLSRIGNSEDAKAINDVIKSMKKQDRVIEDIQREQNWLDEASQFVEKYSDMSEDEMLQDYLSVGAGLGFDLVYKMLAVYKWENVTPEAKWRIGSEDQYEMEHLEIVYKYAITHKIEDVIRKRAAIKKTHKRIEKLQQKLELLQQAA